MEVVDPFGCFEGYIVGIWADEPTGNLDSINGNEVMALLKELNSEGATVVMVTHSEENAREAGRIVRMMDGYWRKAILSIKYRWNNRGFFVLLQLSKR